MEEKHKSNRTFHLQLTTLSPLAINSGEELSPLSDYYVSDGKVYYVDEKKFQQLLYDDEELMSRYEKAVDATKISSADEFLNKLIPIAETRKSISHVSSLPFKGGNTIQMKAIIKSNDNPYIPGSAIKGAIKNAMLYYWLTKLSSKTVGNFISDNKRCFDDFLQCKDRLSELRAITYKKRSEDEQKEFKDLEKKEENVQKIINIFLDDIQKKALDIGEHLYQPASNLKISDSESVSFTENVEVAGLQRRSLKSDVNDWVLNTQEYVKVGVEFDTILQIGNTEQDWENFIKSKGLGQILQESKQNLKPVFTILNHFSEGVKDIQSDFKLVNPTKDIKLKVNEALLCLGSGKGIYKNTVLLAIRKYYEFEAKDFKAGFAPLIANIKSEFDDFPNSVSHINNQPLGWIKITDLDEDAYIEKNYKSYIEEEIRSGKPVEAIFKSIGKPTSKVIININGAEKEYEVQGTKNFLKIDGNKLIPDSKCVVYWRNNQLNFNQ